MQFEIFKNKNLIQGVSDSSFESIGLINNKKAINFLKSIYDKNIKIKNLVRAEQIFSSDVHICNTEDSGKIIKGVDGLISNISYQILVTVSADCVPILFYDSQNKVVAALHGGRECLVRGIIKNTFKKMKINFGSKAKNILVGIGPHIRVCHYWLKEKTYQNLKKTIFKKYFLKRNKIYFDLTKLTFDELLSLGIKKSNIEDCKICTFCQYKKYYSARKAEKYSKIYQEKRSRISSFIGLGY
jgi:YfiH family protein